MTNPTGQEPANPTTMLSPANQRPPTVRALLLAATLLGVAVVSGFVWWLIRHDPGPMTPTAGGQPATSAPATSDGDTTSPSPTDAKTPSEVKIGRFTFRPMAPTDVTSDCAAVSYGKVRNWLANNPCKQVSRGLYATTVGEVKALVSVIAVTMPGDPKASELKGITDTNGTGNVSDMVRDGTVQLPSAPQVAGGGYASELDGDTVTIVEAAFYGGHSDRTLLDKIATAAVGVAKHQG
ncbi:hypothetical protein [Haloechinothrix halophila]|uniref:hypothetical protein n=1 Tax=Haloechinothrix halophila TaxID=1069073 RepID=UPI001E46D5FA|nr:hypothetical protein [Haloechinothrix halophila]